MSKLTKKQIIAHDAAIRLLNQDRISEIRCADRLNTYRIFFLCCYGPD